MQEIRAREQCIILYSESGERDPYRGIDTAKEEGLGNYLSGLGLGQGGFTANSAPVQLELAHARLDAMIVVADWHLLGHAGGVISILKACDANARAVYGPTGGSEERLPVVVSISTYCNREASRWFRDSDSRIMLALVGPPCDVPNRQLGVDDRDARDDLVFRLLTAHGDLSWQAPVAQPTEFAVVPVSLVERVTGTYPGLGCIAYPTGAEDVPVQIRQALEAGAHHVMIDWQFGAVGREELTLFCRAITDQFERVFRVQPAQVVNQQPAQPDTGSGGLSLV